MYFFVYCLFENRNEESETKETVGSKSETFQGSPQKFYAYAITRLIKSTSEISLGFILYDGII